MVTIRFPYYVWEALISYVTKIKIGDTIQNVLCLLCFSEPGTIDIILYKPVAQLNKPKLNGVLNLHLDFELHYQEPDIHIVSQVIT